MCTRDQEEITYQRLETKSISKTTNIFSINDIVKNSPLVVRINQSVDLSLSLLHAFVRFNSLAGQKADARAQERRAAYRWAPREAD
jgi:hypothetical protein